MKAFKILLLFIPLMLLWQVVLGILGGIGIPINWDNFALIVGPPMVVSLIIIKVKSKAL